MRVKIEDLSPEKRAAVQDFKADITSVFNDLYEDKWDQQLWERAVGKQSPVRSMWIAIGVCLEVIPIDPLALCLRPLDLVMYIVFHCCLLISWCVCGTERYTRVHDTNILMKAINSRQKCPEEFWENLRDEFIKGPPIFVR